MANKKKYQKINPEIVKDHNGKAVGIYLKYDVYESIFQEMDDLKKRIAFLKKQKPKKIKKI